VEGDIIGKLGYKELLQLIYQLPDTQRTVFNLFVFEQLSHKEIAENLGINENNSRWHLNDARKRLKEKISSM
jgi:RNA polymerase sigma-70 factor (ECF subfamily)